MTHSLDQRNEYQGNALLESNIEKNPFSQFDQWFQKVDPNIINEPNAATLSTINNENKPKSRIILIKEMTSDSFIFYTNYQSPKAKDLYQNPHASLVFYWDHYCQQIRIEGRVSICTPEKNNQYFKSRPFESQVMALISQQSSPLSSREQLHSEYEPKLKALSPKDLQCPDYWGGFEIKASYFEFWQGQKNRLHDRICYQKTGSTWKTSRIYP